MPDSLSKTIPIWCAVMNRLALQFNSERAANWDTDLHTPPSMVSPSEHSQITEKLVEFVGQVLELQTDWAKVLRNLNKPLRPLWVTPDSILVEQDWSELDFIPIVCLTASESVQNGMDSRVGYVYVPGSADDHELWSQGLDHHLFWKHSEELLNCKDSAACEEAVLWIVSDTRNQLDSTAKSLSSSAPFHFLGNTGLAIGNRKSSQPPDCWNNFDAIINCGAPEFNGICDANPDSYLYLAIPEGKRGQNELFRSIPTALNFALKFLKDNNRILIHCMQGKPIV